MRSGSENDALREAHTPTQIANRLASARAPSLMADAVLGGIDGCITSFAIVCAAHGAGLGSQLIVVLGAASLVADGFSMGVSNYQAAATLRDQREHLRRTEHAHIERVPDGEREEIRQIFARKGLAGDALEEIVTAITSNRETWVETMLSEEHQVPAAPVNPVRAALATFCAFVAVGALPLVPFGIGPWSTDSAFLVASLIAAASFFSIGLAKAAATAQSRWKGGVAVLLVGGIAAALAFGAARLTQGL